MGLAASISTLYAQPAGHTLLELRAQEQARFHSPAMATDGSGGIWVAYRTVSEGQLRGRLLLHRMLRGAKQALPEDGFSPVPADWNPTEPHLYPDGQAGVYLLWLTGTERAGQRLMLTQVNAEGRVVGASTGLALDPHPSRSHQPACAPDYSGGLWVAWLREDPATGLAWLMARHLRPGGTLAPPVMLTPQPQRIGHVQWVLAPGQPAWLVWQGGTAVAPQLQAAAFTAEDATHPPTVVTLPLQGHPAGASLQAPDAAPDGFGGVVMVGEAKSLYRPDADLFMLRLNRTGTVSTPITVCEWAADQRRPHLYKRGSDLVVTWEDYRDGEPDIWYQTLDLDRGLTQPNAGGQALHQAHGTESHLRTTPATFTGEVVMAWLSTGRTGAQLVAQKLNAESGPLWQRSGITLTDSLLPLSGWQLVGDDRGGAWLAWVDLAEAAVRVQHLQNSGLPTLGPSGKTLSRLPQGLHPEMAFLTAVAGTEKDFYLAWEDYRHGQTEADIYVARLDRQGRPIWGGTARPVCRARGRQSLPVLCPAPEGVYVGWLDRRSGQDEDVYVQYLDTAGNARWAPDGLGLCTVPRSQNALRLVPLGLGDLMAVWTDSRELETTGFDLYFQRVNTSGQVQGPPGGWPLAREPGYQTSPSVVADGQRGAVVAWMDNRSGTFHIYTQRLDPQGITQWGPSGRQLVQGADDQRYPHLTRRPDNTLVATWIEERPGSQLSRVYYTALLPGGARPWGMAPLPGSVSVGAQFSPRAWCMPRDGSPEALLLWVDERHKGTSGHHIYAQLLGARGEWRWGTEGKSVAPLQPENAPLAAAWVPTGNAYGDGQGLALWLDHRSTPRGLQLTTLPLHGSPVAQTLASAQGHQSHPVLVADGAGHVLAAWLEHDVRTQWARLCTKMLR